MEYSNTVESGITPMKNGGHIRVQQNRIWPLPRFKRTGQDLVVLERSPIYKSIRISLCTGHYHRVHTEWQWPFSGVHSIMMENFVQAGKGGECTRTSFHNIYHHVQSCCVRYAPAERAATLLLFLLFPFLYSVVSAAKVGVSHICSMRVDANVYSESTKTDHPLKWEGHI
jgi:hypothetical protein